LNKGLKKLARLSALSIKAKEDSIVVIEKFDFEAPKTKEFTNILKALEWKTKNLCLCWMGQIIMYICHHEI